MKRTLAFTRHGLGVKRTFCNLIYFNEVDKGGHSRRVGEPELLAQEVCAAFKSLR